MATEIYVKKRTTNTSDQWYTPEFIMEKVREVLGTIDVDPASHDIAQEHIKATVYYTAENDGLTKEWDGQVWCNPPYSAVLIKKFTVKWAAEVANGNIKEGIILTNSGTDTLWNQNICHGLQAYTIGRISFMQPDGSIKNPGSRGQVFTYFGDNPDKFIEVFTRDNFCWIPNLVLRG